MLIRRKRMQGYDALWLPGTDHAGIATQNVVERQLAEEGKTRHDLGREEFVERVWEWKARVRRRDPRPDAPARRLVSTGTRERFTLDEGLSRAVQTIFKRLYDDGLIYRGQAHHQLVPALPDRAVRHRGRAQRRRGRAGLDPVRRRRDSVVVATTRPETMLGDTAVAVHPDDERYAHLIGTDGASCR